MEIGPSSKPKPKDIPKKAIVALIFLVFSVALLLFALWFIKLRTFVQTPQSKPPNPSLGSSSFEIKKFVSEDEFKQYLEKSQSLDNSYFAQNPRNFSMSTLAPASTGADSKNIAERVSTTNVQVAGIDEPDIIKVDNKNIYFSSNNQYYSVLDSRKFVIPNQEIAIYPPIPQPTSETKVISASPPKDLSEKSSIPENGELLLQDNILVVFAQGKILGYDISDSLNPTKKWEIKLDVGTQVVSSRLYYGKVYVVLSNTIDFSHPCPITPLMRDGSNIIIPCTDIYHPIIDTFLDTLFTAFIVNPSTGKTEKSLTFTGSFSFSNLYMSPNALYISYVNKQDFYQIYLNFYKNKGRGLLPNDILKKIDYLNGLDITNLSKYTELIGLIQNNKLRLSRDDQIKFESDLENKLRDYSKEHLREFESTGLVKININNFNIQASSSVPGQLLNQFSMDEYNDFLRVATNSQGGFLGVNNQSVNDVYVLDSNLKMVGSVTDLGKGEEIYSVRFIDNLGYLVTFRQIDPFYVLDLSNPKNPQVKGELKIPGFSSYLDPLDKNRILGIGQENSKVKISLFDVSSPENPTELTKYNLDEYYTEVSNNHHAFLKDTKHKVFFIPSGKGGYIFSYGGDDLKLLKTVSGIQAKRAVYINDYFYIISEDKIVVLDEKNWQNISELKF